MTTGLVVVSFNRPEYAERCVKSIERHLSSVVDNVVFINDGSDAKHNGAYKRVYRVVDRMGGIVGEMSANGGVAKAKNQGLRYLLNETDSEWMFVCEDDIIIQSPNAVTAYIDACKATDMHHLSFAHHGPANLNVPDGDGPVSFFPHSIGAWTIFSRECLEKTGLMDENFVCAWEHVEHEIRLIQAGYMPGSSVHQFPDASGSAAWITEIPGSIERSSIRPRPDWQSNIRNGLIYWRDNRPETFELIFGDSMPLHNYAMSIIK